MIILFLLIMQIFIMLKKAKMNKNLVIITTIAILWNVGFLTILHLELMLSGASTYGSDESDYFSKMLYASNLDSWFSFVKSDFNFTYVLFGTLILKTSWFDSIYLIRLGNVLLLINVVILVYLFSKRFLLIQSTNLYWLILFIATNGMITWTAIRNLKDTLFIYALIIFIYLLFDLIVKRKLNIFKLIAMTMAIYVLVDIRQWFFYFLVFLFSVIVVIGLLKRKKYISLIISGVVLSVFVLKFAEKGLGILNTYTKSRFSDGQVFQSMGDLLNLPVLMAQFILGPGPIRGFFGYESFLVTTTTGNILITIGSLAWWFFLPLFFLALLSFKNIKENYILLIVLLFYWATYSYANMGSGDTRVRAVLYILCVIYTLPFLERFKRRNSVLKYLAILVPLFIVGAFFSYQTLV